MQKGKMYSGNFQNKYYPIFVVFFLFFSGIILSAAIQWLVHILLGFNQSTLLDATFYQVVGFLLPTLLFVYFNYSKSNSFIQFDWTQSLKIAASFILLVIAAILFSQRLEVWNNEWLSGFNLPFLKQMEQQSSQITIDILQNQVSIGMKIILIALVPAVCEELFFRGLMLPAFGNFTNLHLANFLTALIFSMLHFQPFKIAPMFFLALVLGYIYLYTRNIFYNIILHFINNAWGVIAFTYQIDVGQWDRLTLIPSIFFLMVTVGIIIFFQRLKPRKRITTYN